MKQFALFITLAFFVFACGDSGTDESKSNSSGDTPKTETTKSDEADPKGIGEVRQVFLNDPLDADMIASGKNTYEVKCAACHKLTEQRVVGPGWAGVTTKRQPEWIMNMITNTEVMIAKDPVAREQFKECLVAMPNQNLSVGDARDVLEFMFDNDKNL